MNGVIAIEKTDNKKLGKISTTYVAQQSCPVSCKFYNNGCYAEQGPIGIHTKRLNKIGNSAHDLARVEADAIRTLSGAVPLRLHVVGDCKDNYSATTVSEAAIEYAKKAGQPVWTYSHAWRETDRASWNQVSVLASCESIEDVKTARRKGYATCIVVPEFKSNKLYYMGDEKILPCPEQTHVGVTCASCLLCTDDKRLFTKEITIAFAAHGSKKRNVMKRLEDVQQEGNKTKDMSE